MNNDIESRADVELLVRRFYIKLLEDDVLQHIFRQTILHHLEEHLKTISDFWDSILLDANNYRGNVTEKHFSVDKLFNLNQKEFDRWLFLWKQTIDELFNGDKAEMAKSRAQSIADIMLYKLDFMRKNNPE